MILKKFKLLVFMNTYGFMSICRPCYTKDADAKSRVRLLETCKEDIQSQGLLAKGEFIFEIEASELPDDLYFRDAWELDKKTEKIFVNMGKATDLHINNLRKIRNKALEALDIETTQAAQEQNKEALKLISIKAKQLREMPVVAQKEMREIKDIDELKKYIPRCLESNNSQIIA